MKYMPTKLIGLQHSRFGSEHLAILTPVSGLRVTPVSVSQKRHSFKKKRARVRLRPMSPAEVAFWLTATIGTVAACAIAMVAFRLLINVITRRKPPPPYDSSRM